MTATPMPAMLGFCEYPSWLMYLHTKGHTKEIHVMKGGGKSVRWRWRRDDGADVSVSSTLMKPSVRWAYAHERVMHGVYPLSAASESKYLSGTEWLDAQAA